MTRPQTIQRAPKDKGNPYRLINRHAMEDDRLSFEARGVLAYILVKPDDWRIQINDLRRAGSTGRDKVYRILNELIAFGYITREQQMQPDGKMGHMAYLVYENPQVAKGSTPTESLNTEPLPENPYTAKPDTEKPYTENPHHTNKEESTNKEDATNKEVGGEDHPPIGNSPAQTTPQPAPAPLATPMIERAEKVAKAESFDRPATVPATVPAKPKATIASGPYYTGREFINGRIPEGKGKNAVQVYYERHSIRSDKTRLDAPLEDDLKHITDLDRWRDVVKAWHQAGYNPTGVGGMLDWYRDGIPARGGKSANSAAKPAATTDLTFKQWLLKTYYTDVVATVIYQTKKTEKELRSEYEQWLTRNRHSVQSGQ